MTKNYLYWKNDAHQLIFLPLNLGQNLRKTTLFKKELMYGPLKLLEKPKKNINLLFSRSLNVILLLDIKQSLNFFSYLALRGCSTFPKFAYFEVSAKPLVGESGHTSISRKRKFAEPFKLDFRK